MFISINSFSYLILPKLSIRFWYVFTFSASMPKTSINKNRDFFIYKRKIWFSNNIFGDSIPT
ncbi:hypothetical protein Pelsub_P1369 [Pelolinea submarina]|nr:hypothetical protein Pelsub_P1369 [Pelolinea submarina]